MDKAINNKFVSYETPVGCFGTWEEAAVACEQADLDPCLCIKVNVSPTDVAQETAYGQTTRLSFEVRVF